MRLLAALALSTLEEAGLKTKDIDSVVLTGGSTMIPKVQKLFRDLFGDKITAHLDSDEVYVEGALNLYQNIWHDPWDDIFRPLRSMIPVSVGIETAGGVMTKMIRRRAPTPIVKKALFTTNRDNQSTVEITVLNGEMRLAKDCGVIGRFNISGIGPALRGVPRIEISLRAQGPYVITVKAEDKASNVSVTKDFYWYKESIDKEIERMLEESVDDEDRQVWLTNSITPHNFLLSNTLL